MYVNVQTDLPAGAVLAQSVKRPRRQGANTSDGATSEHRFVDSSSFRLAVLMENPRVCDMLALSPYRTK